MSVSLELTVGSEMLGPAPGDPIRMVPVPLLTAKFVAEPDRTQLPPISALPQPPVTVRLNSSSANGAGGPVMTTSLLTLSVEPSSSVTVSLTV